MVKRLKMPFSHSIIMFRPNAPQQGGLDTGLSNNTDGSGRLPVPRGAGMKPRGFTILEILAVISVIAILVGFSIPKFKGMQDEARLGKVRQELKTLQSALESYYIHNRTYPPESNKVCEDSLISAHPRMIDGVLYDPLAGVAGQEYKYQSSPNGRHFVVWSTGLPGQVAPTGITDAGEVTF